MYPTSANFSNLVMDGETPQDLIIVFDNGTVLNSRYGDMVAGSASLTEYAFANTDVTYGECLSSEFSVEISQSVMDANVDGNDNTLVTGPAKAYIGIPFEYDTFAEQTAYATNLLLGSGAEAWTITFTDSTVGLTAPGESQDTLGATVFGLTYNNSPTVTPGGNYTHQLVLPPTSVRFACTVGNTIKVLYRDYYGVWYTGTVTVSGGSYDADGRFIPPAATAGNCSFSYEYSGAGYVDTRDGVSVAYEVCPLGYFQFDSTDAVEGVTTFFCAPDMLFVSDAFSEGFSIADCPEEDFGEGDIDPETGEQELIPIDKSSYRLGAVFTSLCAELGLAADGPSVSWLNGIGYTEFDFTYSDTTSARTILAQLAAAAGCNIRMTRDGAVGITRFMLAQKNPKELSTSVPTGATPADVPCTRVVADSSQRKRYMSEAITGLNVYDEEGTARLYGVDTGAVFDLAYSPFIAGQDEAFFNDYLAHLEALPVYKPHTIALTEADPSIMAGDMFSVEYESGKSLLFPLMSQTLYFRGRVTSEYVTTASLERELGTGYADATAIGPSDYPITEPEIDEIMDGAGDYDGGGVRVDSYEELADKPSIEGVTLSGDKSFEDLTLAGITNSELENLLTI